MTFKIGCNVFNTQSYNENRAYREKYGKPVAYAPSIPIRGCYEKDDIIFVAEMNNDTNKIEGIGVIKNREIFDYKGRMYKNPNYGFHFYEGKYWFSRSMILDFDEDIVTMFDTVLFCGKTHQKRGYGIKILGEKVFNNWKEYDYSYNLMYNKLKKLYAFYYKQ